MKKSGWKDKPKRIRWRNSRRHATEKVWLSGELRRWCENCGLVFCTFSKTRRLCTPCECEKYGIDINDVSELIGGAKAEKDRPDDSDAKGESDGQIHNV